MAEIFRHHLVRFMSHKTVTKIEEYRQEITSSRAFASMRYSCITRNPAKFLSILSAFNIVGIVIILVKNVKKNLDRTRKEVQFLQHLSPR